MELLSAQLKSTKTNIFHVRNLINCSVNMLKQDWSNYEETSMQGNIFWSLQQTKWWLPYSSSHHKKLHTTRMFPQRHQKNILKAQFFILYIHGLLSLITKRLFNNSKEAEQSLSAMWQLKILLRSAMKSDWHKWLMCVHKKHLNQNMKEKVTSLPVKETQHLKWSGNRLCYSYD